MAEFVSVLNSVIRISEIKKIHICYDDGTNYANNWIQNLFVHYKDGTSDKFSTTDRAKAKEDYEGLKNALLNYGAKMDGKDEKDDYLHSGSDQ